MLLPLAGCCALPCCSPLYSLEKALLFYPTCYPEGNWDPKGLCFEDAWFEAADGVTLHGWFCPVPNPRAVVLYAHGNAGNVTSYAETLKVLCEQMRVSVLAFDYRGYGKSQGEISEQGILTDARAARRWLARRTGVAERDIVLMGYSLGGGVVVDLAAFDGARGLILESTFTSLPDVAAQVTPLPVHSLMRTRMDSLAKIRLYHGPLLQTHGDADRVVPIALGRQLFDAAHFPKEFVSVPGAGHIAPPSPEYLMALNRFFDTLPPCVRP
jgi:fermentation-respiration switch protein FrsA (DUF1100 family)